MTERRNRALRTWLVAGIGIAVSVLFGLLTFGSFSFDGGHLRWTSRMPAEAVAMALRSVTPFDAFLFVALTWATVPMRAWSWGLILRPRGTSSDRYHATSIGFFAVNVLPARLGEVTRGLVMASRTPGLSRAQAVGSVLLARVLDLWALWLLCLPLPLFVSVSEAKKPALLTAFGVATVLVVASVLLVGLARRQARGHRKVFGSKAFASFLSGVGAQISTKSLLKALGATVLIQLVSAAAYVPILMRLCPEVPSLAGSVWALAGLSLGLAIPSTPSGVGVYHFAMSFALEGIGAVPANAAAAAVVTHAGSLVAFVAAGLVSLSTARLGFGALLGRGSDPARAA